MTNDKQESADKIVGLTDGLGAVDLEACPSRSMNHKCWCGKCALCGFSMHMAIHGPSYGAAPGTKPWGHEYVSISTVPNEIVSGRPPKPEDAPL